MKRSILAVLIGYVAIMVCVVVTTALATFVLPTPAYLAGNLVGGLFSAAVGGYVAAWIANRSKMAHAWVLAAMVVVLGAVMAVNTGRSVNQPPPAWYPYAILVIGGLGVALGGKLRVGRARVQH